MNHYTTCGASCKILNWNGKIWVLNRPKLPFVKVSKKGLMFSIVIGRLPWLQWNLMTAKSAEKQNNILTCDLWKYPGTWWVNFLSWAFRLCALWRNLQISWILFRPQNRCSRLSHIEDTTCQKMQIKIHIVPHKWMTCHESGMKAGSMRKTFPSLPTVPN